jgi:Arc/MetJ-type ribon-helix-helix transcriptional regulator
MKRVNVSHRLPVEFIKSIRAAVKNQSAVYRSVSQVIEIAVAEWLEKQKRGGKS